MKQHFSFAVECFAMALAVAIVMRGLSALFLPKYYADSTYSTTTTALEFYALEEDSADVLFLGSSHAMAAFDPMELYLSYGITSYNLGTDEQSLLISYYWLREALKTQSPKVVVLDTYIAFQRSDTDAVLNCNESAIRKALNYMKLSPVKCEAISAICEEDDSQSMISYYLTTLRFHSRWTELTEEDFPFSKASQVQGLMGYTLITSISENPLVFETVKDVGAEDTAEAAVDPAGSADSGSTAETTDLSPVMEKYLNKIIALCKERGIDLILVKTPTTAQTQGRHDAMTDYAAENGVPFYDLNEETLYDAIGFDFAWDVADNGHATHSGAVKITDFIGDLLTREYGLTAHIAQDWEDIRSVYETRLAGLET